MPCFRGVFFFFSLVLCSILSKLLVAIRQGFKSIFVSTCLGCSDLEGISRLCNCHHRSKWKRGRRVGRPSKMRSGKMPLYGSLFILSYRIQPFNSLPNDKILDCSKLKEFADDKNITENLKFVLGRRFLRKTLCERRKCW